MTGFTHRCRRLLLPLLPFLAATLACNALAGGGASPDIAFTQAAATIQAASNQAAIARAAVPTAAASPSAAPTVVPPTAANSATPTTAGSPTAAASATPAVSPTAQPAAAVVLDPCTLISADEARTLVGVKLGPARQQGSGCLYTDATATHGLSVYALPPAQSQSFFQQFVAGLKQDGIKVDAGAETKLNQDLAAQDLVAATNDLIGISSGQAKFKAQKVDGVGSTALWFFNALDQLHVVSTGLVAATPGGLVALSMAVEAPVQEAQEQALIEPYVNRILDGLPPNFSVKGLQTAGSAPAIDPCALATADDIQAIMGAKPGAGQAIQGECFYVAASNPQVQVRVYALPPGEGAIEAVSQLESMVLLADPTTKAKVDADVQAGDLVAAVRQLSTAAPSFLGKPEVVDGLGDAAVYMLGAPAGSPLRIGYLAAARPGALVGLSLLLSAGDSAATKAAAIALATKIMASLPDKFTVTGAP